MAELVPLVPVEDEETDHQILKLRVSGLSVLHGFRVFNLTAKTRPMRTSGTAILTM